MGALTFDLHQQRATLFVPDTRHPDKPTRQSSQMVLTPSSPPQGSEQARRALGVKPDRQRTPLQPSQSQRQSPRCTQYPGLCRRIRWLTPRQNAPHRHTNGGHHHSLYLVNLNPKKRRISKHRRRANKQYPKHAIQYRGPNQQRWYPQHPRSNHPVAPPLLGCIHGVHVTSPATQSANSANTSLHGHATMAGSSYG